MYPVALVVYSGNHYRRDVFKWNFAKSNEEFKKVVSDLRAIGGTTNTAAALDEALKLMETRNRTIPTIVMVVTDGRSFVDPAVASKKLQQIPNTWMFAAATGDPNLVDRKELLEIAGHINHVVMQTGRELASTIARRLLREAQDKCRCEQDLVLVMDFSTTTSRVYKQYQILAERLLRQLYVSPRHTRVALVVFSSEKKTYTRFNLNDFDNADDVITMIKNTQYIGGLTALGSGIKEALKQADERNGARPKVAPKFMLVFTDGWVNNGPEPEGFAKQAIGLGFRVFSIGVEANRPAESIRVRQHTLDSIVANKADHYSDTNFDGITKIVRQRNEYCLANHIEK
ncbi:Protein C18H7.1 [Aphelenchoides avenae]|nr:Protein C18H7.1 [Aphelenchus avenae]